jgi:hypothetical protein
MSYRESSVRLAAGQKEKPRNTVQHDVQPISELVDLSTWTLAVVKVGLVYTLAGSGVTKVDAIPNDPAVIEKVNHNAAVFAPEMGPISTP